MSVPQLICPACRRVEEEQFLSFPLALPPSTSEEPADLQAGVLICTGCGHQFPIFDGVPLVVKDVGDYLEKHLPLLSLRSDLPPESMAFLLRGAPPGSPLAQLYTYLNAYLVAHYPEQARVQGISAAPQGEPGWWPIVQKELSSSVADLGGGGRALVVGCAVGRELQILADLGMQVVGLESSFIPARIAQQLCRGQTHHGLVMHRNEQLRAFSVQGFEGTDCNVVVGDVLDPPFPAYSFDLVVLLNLIDAVASPLTMLQQCHALVRKGGQMLLASPFHWSPVCTEPRERFGDSWRAVGGVNAGLDVLLALLEGRLIEGFRTETLGLRKRIPWVLRRHEQSYDIFLSDMVRVRV